MSNEWPKTVVIGLSRAGNELELHYREGQAVEQSDWSFVRTAYRLFANGSREDVEQALIDSFNDDLKRIQEHSDARFDRLKAEAHERHERENNMRISVATPVEVARFHAQHALVDAMTVPLPLDIPLFAGPRHGLND